MHPQPSSTNPLRQRTYALIGLMATLPALLMIAIGSSMVWAPGNPAYVALDQAMSNPQFHDAFNIVSPIAILGGLTFALVLNVLPILSFRASRLNIAVVVLSLLAVAVIFGFALAENWQCILGVKVSC